MSPDAHGDAPHEGFSSDYASQIVDVEREPWAADSCDHRRNVGINVEQWGSIEPLTWFLGKQRGHSKRRHMGEYSVLGSILGNWQTVYYYHHHHAPRPGGEDGLAGVRQPSEGRR